MFDLEKSIAKWRKQMLAAGIKSPVPLEELELHLREEIERRTKFGANAQQAFEMTVAQIGDGKELKTEFAKGSRLRNILETELIKKESELKWMPVLLMVALTFGLLFFSMMVLLKMGPFSDATSLERMSSLAAVVVSYLLFNAGVLGYRFFPVVPNKHARGAISVCGAVVVSFWLMIFLVRAHVNMQQFVAEFSWAFFVPISALNGLVFGLEWAAQKKIEASS